jgi:hypothetical protein
MNTYVTEIAENSIPTLASTSIFFDDCCGRYYSVITGIVYTDYDIALNDTIDMLTRNLNKLTR